MTQPASKGIALAFAAQSGKGTGYPTDGDFKKVKALQSSLGIMQSVDVFDLEVGGGYHQGGAYKGFVTGAGAVRFHPRLEGDIATLLQGLAGDMSATGDVSTSEHGYYTYFMPADDLGDIPWLTLRKFIPNTTAALREGQEMRDARVGSGQITVQAGSPAIMDLAFMAIQPSYGAAFSAFDTTMTAGYEDYSSVPMAPVGTGPILQKAGVDLGSGAGAAYTFEATQVVIQIANNYSGARPQQELVLGSYYMDDLVMLSQALNFTFVYKWKDPRLQAAIERGDINTYEWSPTPFTSSLSLTLKAHTALPGIAASKYSLTLTVPEVVWQMSPVALQGGAWLSAQVSGIAVEQATPSAYFQLRLETAEPISGVSYS